MWRLDLSMGTMSDTGARAIADHGDAFADLARLDVSRNYLTRAGHAALANVCSRVISDDQNEADDGDRFVSVGE